MLFLRHLHSTYKMCNIIPYKNKEDYNAVVVIKITCHFIRNLILVSSIEKQIQLEYFIVKS